MRYKELSRVAISDTRTIVVSEAEDSGYTVAQQLNVTEGQQNKTSVFMKGAFHISDLEALEKFRDVISAAIAVLKA